ncbi:methyl-accepting chemotaxis protein [Pseudomonas sp. 3JA]|uniref:methyl-accepting chemotaxis protein n=1 Tax=Pseudomonas sp. 3JA TaxID=3109347 RepID=UPI003FA6D942
MGQILGIIRAVGEQITLLALNAAIELARAGEQGHSSALVGEEVRGLALRTQAATLQFEGLITGFKDIVRHCTLGTNDCCNDSRHTVEVIRRRWRSLPKSPLR